MGRKLSIFILAAILFAAGNFYLLYPRFFSPIYVWEINIPVDQSFSTSKLITDEGIVYWEKKLAQPDEYEYGRQIGRTADGMRIYEIKGDSANNEVMLTGFMFPCVIFQKE